jgi:hypothetical protein
MRVDESDRASKELEEINEPQESHELENRDMDSDTNKHWSCGSSTKRTTAKSIEKEMNGERMYAKFDAQISGRRTSGTNWGYSHGKCNHSEGWIVDNILP